MHARLLSVSRTLGRRLCSGKVQCGIGCRRMLPGVAIREGEFDCKRDEGLAPT